MSSNRTDGIAEAMESVRKSEAVVMVLGITKQQEHEGIDRQDTRLPGQQLNFAQQVLLLTNPLGRPNPSSPSPSAPP